jgi:hypothetical protein
LHDPIAWREVGQAHLRPCLSFAAKRPDSLLHAAEHPTRSQQLTMLATSIVANEPS